MTTAPLTMLCVAQPDYNKRRRSFLVLLQSERRVKVSKASPLSCLSKLLVRFHGQSEFELCDS